MENRSMFGLSAVMAFVGRMLALGILLWHRFRPEGRPASLEPRAPTPPDPALIHLPPRSRPLRVSRVEVRRFAQVWTPMGTQSRDEVGMVAYLMGDRVMLSGPCLQEIDEMTTVDRTEDPHGYLAELLRIFAHEDQAVVYGDWYAIACFPERARTSVA